MGSGSTLLRLILDSHDNIGIPQETGFMRAYNAHEYVPFKWSGRNWARRMGWTPKELDQELAAFYDRIFSRYAAQHGKQRWGDKTPFHTWHMGDMARVFPDAAFIAIVRHPGGCVGSNMTRWGQSIRHAIDHYRRYNMEIARRRPSHGTASPSSATRSWCCSPEPVLRELLDWLGEPWSDSVLEHHAVQGSRGGKRKVEGRSLVDDPIDVSRMASGATRMEERNRAVLSRRLDRLASSTATRRRPRDARAAARGRADRRRHRPRRPRRAVRGPRPAPPARRPGRRPLLRPAQDKVRSVEALAELGPSRRRGPRAAP